MTTVTAFQANPTKFLRAPALTHAQHVLFMGANLADPSTADAATLQAVVAYYRHRIQNLELDLDGHAAAWAAFKRDADRERAEAHAERHKDLALTLAVHQAELHTWLAALQAHNPFSDDDPQESNK